MNKLLFRSATLIHPESKFHKTVVDLLILDGKIEDIAQTIDVTGDDLEIINAEGCFISAGFFDLNANFGEPGNETCEDLISGTSTAVAGGFTGLALQPSTEPPVHSKAGVALSLIHI